MALFAALQTQWQSGRDGRLCGLRYEALPAVWQALGIPRRRRPRLFADLRVMESAVIEALQEESPVT